jgi:Nif-specific regulatory protein
MRARLTIVRGAAEPPICEFASTQRVTLGRSQSNTVVLHDEHASRKHAQVYFEEGHWYLCDCGTRNGTRVNAARLERPLRLVDGQEFGIADLCVRFNVVTGAATTGTAPTPTPPEGYEPVDTPTSLHADELAMLYEFMTAAVEEVDEPAVVQCALATARKLTGASLCGYLSLDPDQPMLRVVEPEEARVNASLSKQLTQRVKKDGQRVWLKQDVGQFDHNDSLLPFDDAVCIPLRAEDGPLGALHVYKKARFFTGREVRCCELVAGFLASHLARLQLCRRLAAENSRLRRHTIGSDELLGASPPMQQLRQMIAKTASCPSTVLIQGETGSGKELVALALHRQSPRRNGPFVVVNCGAIAPTLLESELFGHCDRAFTDARRHQGFFEQADNGTLFLDEIGDMQLDCQVKLLRAIEGKGFRPVGGERDVRADVRVVAATHKDLEKEVAAGRFRQDLFFRLDVIHLVVPPLRDRMEDLPEIAEHFVRNFAEQINQARRLSVEAMQRLCAYGWPGNVRELRAVLERAVMLCEDETIEPHELRLRAPASAGQPPTLDLEQLQAWAIKQALRQTEGNISAAARLVGLSRGHIGVKMKDFNIDKDDWKKDK